MVGTMVMLHWSEFENKQRGKEERKTVLVSIIIHTVCVSLLVCLLHEKKYDSNII